MTPENCYRLGVHSPCLEKHVLKKLFRGCRREPVALVVPRRPLRRKPEGTGCSRTRHLGDHGGGSRSPSLVRVGPADSLVNRMASMELAPKQRTPDGQEH